MQLKVQDSKSTAEPSTLATPTGQDALTSNELSDFCQFQADQLAAHLPILFARIVYYDPYLKAHQDVNSQPLTAPGLTQETLAYLKSNSWLSDFPLVLTLTELSLAAIAAVGYVCPLGYRNQAPEYLLIVTHQPLESASKSGLLNCAKQLINYLNLYRNSLDQQAEIQLLEQVVHRVGHQLRNPLGLISLYAENLRLGLPGGSLQEQVTVIHNTTEDILTNLTNLINCGKGSHLRVTLQDLRDLMSQSIEGLQPFIRQKQLTIDIPETSVMLMVDRLQLKQVFDNLLSNAVHFSPQFGSINVDWRIFQSEVLIQITDQGPGLSPEEVQKIFHPFYSRRPGGTGLGLTIAKKIVLDHQGSLWAQPPTENGASFSLTLPRLRQMGESS
ncbi:HAMP domain-containing histidine kinase [Oculatella sp. LEGE 06141]|uniref:sensor histidine kinase n=1 Tax=Oculatella sp. LEGE 06141 TaxID=1828648 RepID=UPI001883071E|nr:HAMP domain-containing sensor histidine kinase [Oculatella sp. LEGE 06141]MBE9181990.1 HAMP domain-containing histidine kinase [Oculatella sp. LEGE 06141]